MSKCENFIKFFDELVESNNVILPDEVAEFREMLVASQDNFTDKPAFTEIGLTILEYLQICGTKSIKAKEIAEGIDAPSRKVSGAMRKLVSDGYVEKFGQNPVIYALTTKGKNLNINDVKGE